MQLEPTGLFYLSPRAGKGTQRIGFVPHAQLRAGLAAALRGG